jgi:hypothetical protein
MGQRIVSSGVGLTLLGVEKLGEINAGKAPNGKVYLVVDAQIETVDRDAAPFNASYFRVRDANGTEYSNLALTFGQNVTAGSLSRGQSIHGCVIFEVAQDAKGFVVSYQPNVFLGGYAPIQIGLGF